MIEPETDDSPALAEAARELEAARHDAQVAFDCVALGELDRAHTHALIARVAVDAAVTALAAALGRADQADADQADQPATVERRQPRAVSPPRSARRSQPAVVSPP